MQKDHFYPPQDGLTLSSLVARIGGSLRDPDTGAVVIRGVAPVYRAKPGDICYILSRKNKHELDSCQASAIICDPGLVYLVPAGIPILLHDNASMAFALAGALLFPEAERPLAVTPTRGVSPQAVIDPSARLEADVTVEPFAVIGADVEIGAGTLIGPGVVIGRGVRIGRGCTIAAGASLLSALIGNNVIIHNGARIGQDGFGYAAGPAGMTKIVQIGRVILQDNVEIGANTTIDRGTMDDTVVGEGTKIDNQVQIGHNVRIGRHCAIVSQVGIAGSTRIGNGVMIGGAAGINGHITIGDGAQIGAMSGVISDVPAGAKLAGMPARPLKDFLRDAVATIAHAEARGKEKGRTDG